MKTRIHARNLLTICLIIAVTLAACGQSKNFDIKPNGSAVVVSNIETSVKWYQSVFGLKVKSTINDPNNAYKVVILESKYMMLELLELKGAVVRSEVLKGKPDGTQIQGHFKIGFTVDNIDACLQHLKELKIDVPRVWTDSATGKRNFLVTDPDGNYIQFFD